MFYKKLIHIVFCFAVGGMAVSFSGGPNVADCRLRLSFQHFVGKEILQLDSVVYKNDLGQTFTVSKFKYYISNFHFKNQNGRDFYLPASFLINEEMKESRELLLNSIPEGAYTSIDFIVGVDSTHNCSGAQSGALDPVNAMFWAWNTGYIFLKLEGRSLFSKSPGNFFEYHIGGYRSPANNIRKISLDLGSQKLFVGSQQQAALEIKVDLLEMLKTPTSIDFEKIPVVNVAANSGLIADNYCDMFKVAVK
ncbi:MAG TPA: hypothetical protein PL029_00070 [Bacteroidia bacterium]|nr:hypothetical protein [Bacteroidia bacterium]